jgi:dihydroorotase
VKQLTITRPDDWHLHLRDGDALKAVLADTTQRFARAVVMPNLRPPITTVKMACDYRQRILDVQTPNSHFTPLMTLYLTDKTSVKDVEEVSQSEAVVAFKLYPAGATTNSDSGVTHLSHCDATFSAMESLGVPLLVHAEVTDRDVDVFDREAVFIERHMRPLIQKFPKLKIVFEHITTKEAVLFVEESSEQIAATITPHHLLLNRNAIFAGGIRPHHYCLPILKREEHRLALLRAATSGSAKFFLGTDSAPHAKVAKEAACGCAGIYSAHAAIELYAEAFEQMDALDKLEAFASFYGADFYGLPRNNDCITLVKEAWTVPEEIPFNGGVIVPMRAGEEVTWKVR